MASELSVTTAACGTSTWSRFVNEPAGLTSNFRICPTLHQLEEDFDVVELSAHQRLKGRAQHLVLAGPKAQVDFGGVLVLSELPPEKVILGFGLHAPAEK